MSLCIKPSVFNDFVDYCVTGKRNRMGARVLCKTGELSLQSVSQQNYNTLVHTNFWEKSANILILTSNKFAWLSKIHFYWIECNKEQSFIDSLKKRGDTFKCK